MSIHHLRKRSGFTLIELVVAISLFAFISVTAVSAMIAVVDGNTTARSLVKATDGLSFALESMTRELRVGSQYSCDGSGDCDHPNPGTRIEFITSDGFQMAYRLNSGVLQRCGIVGDPCDDPATDAEYVDMTGGNVEIDTFNVYVSGSADVGAGDFDQPRATLVIEGTAGGGSPESSSFSIQTTVTQRFPDF